MDTIQSIEYRCPHCWEKGETRVVPAELPAEFIEDCEVCCHPITMRAILAPDGQVELAVESAA